MVAKKVVPLLFRIKAAESHFLGRVQNRLSAIVP